MLLHHNTHVHTFVGGTGASAAASWSRTTAPIGTFSYEIILTATDSSGLKASTSVTCRSSPTRRRRSAPTGLTATAVGGEPAST